MSAPGEFAYLVASCTDEEAQVLAAVVGGIKARIANDNAVVTLTDAGRAALAAARKDPRFSWWASWHTSPHREEPNFSRPATEAFDDREVAE